MSTVLVSYRRSANTAFVRCIIFHLEQVFGRKNVLSSFHQEEALGPALPFDIDAIRHRMERTNAIVVVIDPHYVVDFKELSPSYESDVVKIELEMAMTIDIPLIPVMINGAHMPSAEELPPTLADLTHIQGLTVHGYMGFSSDMDELVYHLLRVLRLSKMRVR